MAEGEQAIARASGNLPPAASANKHLAELRITDRHILPQIADAVAEGAIGIAESIDP